MADSLNKLWLKGKAEEDIYIAKRERELKKKKLQKRGYPENKSPDPDKH
jgi:hypothetical protein